MATISEECREFLMQGTRTGKLAVVRRDGSPQVVPIWFVLDGDDILFNTGADTLKGKAMRRNPHVSLCVDDETPPYSFATINGTVTLSEDLAEVRRWATAIGGRYMGADRAEEFGARNGVAGELLVRLTPTKIIFQRDLAD